jgi:hypothetical protein
MTGLCANSSSNCRRRGFLHAFLLDPTVVAEITFTTGESNQTRLTGWVRSTFRAALGWLEWSSRERCAARRQKERGRLGTWGSFCENEGS